MNFSLFKFNKYYTLEEILDNNKVDFTKKELLQSLCETIKNLNYEGTKFYICPFITPSNVLYTESSGKEYFYLSEIFISSDSIEKEIEIDLKITSEWLVPEFLNKKTKITFFFKYLLFRIFVL